MMCLVSTNLINLSVLIACLIPISASNERTKTRIASASESLSTPPPVLLRTGPPPPREEKRTATPLDDRVLLQNELLVAGSLGKERPVQVALNAFANKSYITRTCLERYRLSKYVSSRGQLDACLLTLDGTTIEVSHSFLK